MILTVESGVQSDSGQTSIVMKMRLFSEKEVINIVVESGESYIAHWEYLIFLECKKLPVGNQRN